MEEEEGSVTGSCEYGDKSSSGSIKGKGKFFDILSGLSASKKTELHGVN
jgi:hypothetical protein